MAELSNEQRAHDIAVAALNIRYQQDVKARDLAVKLRQVSNLKDFDIFEVYLQERQEALEKLNSL